MNHRSKVPRICLTCGRDFFAIKSEVNRGYGKYCSRKCAKTGKANPFWGKGYTQEGKAHPNWHGGITPPQKRAHNILNRAVKKGEIVPQACEECGSTTNVDGHHDDYSKPLEVHWLCRSCHAKKDGRIKKLNEGLRLKNIAEAGR